MKRSNSLLISVAATLALLVALVAPALAAGPPTTTASPSSGPFTVIAQGLNNPRGLAFGPDGSLYVAEAGKGGSGPCSKSPEGGQSCFGTTGAITQIKNGQQTRIVTGLPSVAGQGGMQASGPSDVAVHGNGNVYVTVQGVDSSSPKVFGDTPLWHLIRLQGNGMFQQIADFYTYEAQHNPDGREINSDPYAVLALPGMEIVADAAANDLLKVSANGQISTLAVFPTRMEKGPGGQEIPMESVPDALALGPDGSYYVGELTGFPFPVGGARVYNVPADGGQPQVVASGFTNIIGLAFGSDGSMYVLELTKGGLGNVNPKDPSTMTGALIRVAPDGTRTTVASDGLVMPAGLAIGSDGSIYVSNFGVLAGAGQVVKINPPAGAPPASVPSAPASSHALTSSSPVSGQLTGTLAGSFATYTIDYPGNGVVGTLDLKISSNNPSVANAVGVDLYQGKTRLATMNAVGSPPGTNSVTFSSADKGPVLVQVYNYAPGATVSYQLSLSGISGTGPSSSAPTAMTPAPPTSGTGASAATHLTKSASGMLPGSTAGSFAYYTVDYPTANAVQTVNLTFAPGSADVVNAVAVNVYQNGKLLTTKSGTQASTPGQLSVSYTSGASGPVLVQLANYNPSTTISYTISQ